MKDKAEWQIKLKYEEISINFYKCILAIMPNFKMLFWHK